MSTNTLLRDDGALRHGHPSLGSPDHAQWHTANTFHRDDPDAHTRERSWESPGWSPQNFNLDRSYKTVLMNWAEEQHDEARRYHQNGYGRYTPSPMPQPTSGGASSVAPREYNTAQEEDDIERRVREMTTSLPQPAPQIDLSDDVEVELTMEPEPEPSPVYEIVDEEPQDGSLGERVAALEDYALAAGPKVDELERKLENVEQQRADLSSHIDTTVELLKEELANVESSVADLAQALTTEKLEEAVAPLRTRIEQLEVSAARKVEYTITRDDKTWTKTGTNHQAFDEIVEWALGLDPEDRNIWIAGPAGSGKTTAARKLAELLELPFEFMGAADSSYKLSGYRDGYGNYNSTAFRRMYENGGVILLDECDGSSPSALLEVNAALANGSSSFPDGMIKRHVNTIVLCAANTWGLGGDANYVGRAKLDAAFLDRFVTVEFNYDEDLEVEAAGQDDQGWVRVVQQVRAKAFAEGAQFVISPRASIKGCQALRKGLARETVVRGIFGRYRNHSMWPTVGEAAVRWATNSSASSNGAAASAASTGRLPRVSFGR